MIKNKYLEELYKRCIHRSKFVSENFMVESYISEDVIFDFINNYIIPNEDTILEKIDKSSTNDLLFEDVITELTDIIEGTVKDKLNEIDKSIADITSKIELKMKLRDAISDTSDLVSQKIVLLGSKILEIDLEYRDREANYLKELEKHPGDRSLLKGLENIKKEKDRKESSIVTERQKLETTIKTAVKKLEYLEKEIESMRNTLRDLDKQKRNIYKNTKSTASKPNDADTTFGGFKKPTSPEDVSAQEKRNKVIGVAILIAAIAAAYTIYKIKTRKCAGKKGTDKYKCLIKSCDDAIEESKKKQKECKDNRCKASIDKEISKWTKRKEKYKKYL